MKIYEKYSVAERIFDGKGIWIAFLPVRFVLSQIYNCWLTVSGWLSSLYPELLSAAVRDSIRSERPPRVISIGNLVVGGGGKTPCTISLAKEIKKKCGRPVVVTRGYKSLAEKASKPIVISPYANTDQREDYLTEADYFNDEANRISDRLFAETFGDEVSIYRNEEISVVIDTNRRRGIKFAGEILNPTDILLDDAFQNRSVKKDIDILLLDYNNPFANGKVLPMGTLRERPKAAHRADAIVFTRVEGDRIPSEVLRFTAGKRVFYSRHEFSVIYGHNGKIVRPAELKQSNVVLYSGIALPMSFEGMVKREICEPVATFRYSDHHPYNSKDIEFMIREVGEDSVFLTTEKDWFKTNELFPEDVEILAVKMEMVIRGIEELLTNSALKTQ